ncbi:peptide chain release factor N(5)-glutamine methyltransferase [Caldanaerobacter sp.]|uniref:peptide chain release factor N(5)-glutamine methyltransferase n=1 Tax=Caldanaerobacter sp. TaxID=2930036 RepID=UPI003C74D623
MRVYEAIASGARELEGVCENPRLESELLLSHALGVDRVWLAIKRDETLNEQEIVRFFEYIEKRKARVPYQYIVKKQYFMGLEFYVDERVLIPRPETEILVEEVLKRIKKGDIVLDIGTGSGAIAVSIAKHFPECKVYALDISEEALEVAMYNAKRFGVGNILFLKSDIFSNVPDSLKFDVIVSNPPYIKRSEIESLQEEVKKEPVLALDGGEDGLFFFREIAYGARPFLKKGSKIFFEIGYDQRDEVKGILLENGFKNIQVAKDLAGIDRVVIGEYYG